MPKCPNCSNEVETEFMHVATNKRIFCCRHCRSPLRLSAKSWLILGIPFVIAVSMPLYILLQSFLTGLFGIKIPVILDVDKSPLAPSLRFISIFILIFLFIWTPFWWKKFAEFELPDLAKHEVNRKFTVSISIFFAVAVVVILFSIFTMK